jgi:hypothetical protein
VAESQRQTYLDGLLAKALHVRDIGVEVGDHIILLSTCSSSSTNGRDILVGRISDEVYADAPIATKISDGAVRQGPDAQYCLVDGISLLLLILASILAIRATFSIPLNSIRLLRRRAQRA